MINAIEAKLSNLTVPLFRDCSVPCVPYFSRRNCSIPFRSVPDFSNQQNLFALKHPLLLNVSRVHQLTVLPRSFRNEIKYAVCEREDYRAAASTSHNHMTKYFASQKNNGVQWQLNRSCHLTCTPGCVAAQFNRHGNCTTVQLIQ